MMKRLVLTLAAGLALPAPSYAEFNPHPQGINYRENYRGQYHFSPKTGWMNDINALVYHDGKYHMIYQWGKKIRHGGYATSRDLLHWDDRGVALIPQDSRLPKEAVRNVSGSQVFSGSGVVVSGDVAEKITGSPKEAMVAIYTGTKCGTCLAWSNDGGESWHDYKANPVANPTRGTNPRDPCVFLYEPTDTWILAIYQGGTTFYGSKDLIKWERLSNIKFGYECPDMYELPLDGDKGKMKWVLQDAKGSYLVGQFDGKAFTPEQEAFLMDVGPDFYAAQTFFRPNLPVKDLIQIAWQDLWNGGVGEKGWERNATFPVVVGLVTYDGKMRITRTPIEGIRTLYKGTKTWKNETLQEGQNLLEGHQSKTFDMTAVFDLKKSTASDIGFRFANVNLRYDVKNNLFHGMQQRKGRLGPEKGKALKQDADGILRIRMLVDWAQLEVFSAGGVFSYTAHLGFTPSDSSLGLSAKGGEAKLLSLTLNEVARTWPAAPRTERTSNGE
ncbi:MAG: glycoside hydrolase family 32 protein [Phycisphaerae bacterium]|nr:glycoside hydrolase family 32 protein [Phycisphaerae bacterium]